MGFSKNIHFGKEKTKGLQNPVNHPPNAILKKNGVEVNEQAQFNIT